MAGPDNIASGKNIPVFLPIPLNFNLFPTPIIAPYFDSRVRIRIRIRIPKNYKTTVSINMQTGLFEYQLLYLYSTTNYYITSS
jgi:hypothetical protein